MKTSSIRITFLLFAATAVFSFETQAGTISFGPTPYLSAADRPEGFFCDECPIVLEDFEDNDATNTGLTFSDGRILLPNSLSGLDDFVTDSVDGDDGSIDGNGNAGHSYFYAGQSISISFSEPVTTAGLVWTDGDVALNSVIFEAFDSDMNLLGMINAGDLSDDYYTGQTAEDRFLGIQSMAGISMLTISNTGGGLGIEIDHIQYQNCPECVPEPGTLTLGLSAMLMAVGLVRRRNR